MKPKTYRGFVLGLCGFEDERCDSTEHLSTQRGLSPRVSRLSSGSHVRVSAFSSYSSIHFEK